jgi:hypothetical protein
MEHIGSSHLQQAGVVVMAGGLTFEQVKKARVFAWHEWHYVFANDTLLRVVTRDHTSLDANFRDLGPMHVRPSSLRGTEHLLDDGWHHLDNCSCPFCCPHEDQAARGAESRDRCSGPTR